MAAYQRRYPVADMIESRLISTASGSLDKLLAPHVRTGALMLILALLVGLLLIRLSPLEGLLLVGGSAVVIGALIEPLIGLAAALFLGPLKAYLSAEVGQVPAQIAHVFIALALASWLAHGLARREVRFPHSPLLLPLLAFFGVALLSLWDAVGLLAYGAPELLKWAQVILLLIFISDHLGAERDSPSAKLSWAVGALLLSGLFQACVGIWQFGLRGEGPEHFAIASVLGGDFYRAYGTFEQPNPYAGFLGLMLPLALGSLWGAVTRSVQSHRLNQSSVYAAAAALAMLAALGMSWSRGAWLGFGAALLAMAFALPRKAGWRILLVVTLIAGAGGIYASGLLPASITARLTGFIQDLRTDKLGLLEDVRGVPINDSNYAVIERLAHWQTALSMFRYNFWTGVGFGCYEPNYPSFALINWPIALGHAHNYYLNLLAEIGLVGLTAYLALWAVIFWQTWGVIRRARGFPRGIAVGLLGTWTHLSVHHLLDNLYVNNVHLHFGVLLGILAWLVRSCSHTQSSL